MNMGDVKMLNSYRYSGMINFSKIRDEIELCIFTLAEENAATVILNEKGLCDEKIYYQFRLYRLRL